MDSSGGTTLAPGAGIPVGGSPAVVVAIRGDMVVVILAAAEGREVAAVAAPTRSTARRSWSV